MITPPRAGQPFCGQDAQFVGHPASYARSADGDNSGGKRCDIGAVEAGAAQALQIFMPLAMK